MSSSKFNQMFNFISHYKYEISKNVPDNLKCAKCKNILINAHCVPCGCSYCCDCMNEMIENSVENCPGTTVDCKDELISNNHLDCKANKEISNVVIKCPEEMCLFECTIIKMDEHVRVCEKKVKCPFSSLGCEGQNSKEMMNDHCQSANFNHCKILIEIIDNIRNEIGILKTNEKNQLTIENLEKNLKLKDEKIDKINEEIEMIKMMNETAKREFDSFKLKLERKLEGIDDKMKRENERMEIEHKRQLDEINENFEKKAKEIFTKIQKEKQEQIESINDETNKKSEMMETKINELNKVIDKNRFPIYEWIVDKLNEKKKKDECIWSEYFTTIIIKQYKLQLSFWANGRDDIYGKGCSIYLWIYPGTNDQFLSWPFTADVTIKVVSKINPNINKTITKYCKIDKPIDVRNSSEAFNYFYSDLTTNGEMLDNSFIIECFIDYK